MIDLQKIKLAICVPCKDTVYSEFSLCVHRLLKYNFSKNIDTEVFYNTGTCLSHQREYAVLSSQKFDATHVLWLDSDMIFPNHTAYTLLSHDKDVVAANYNTRRPPHYFVGMTDEIFDENGSYKKGSHLKYNKHTMPSKDLIEVNQIGLGCMLVKMEIYKTIPRPWFEIKKHPKSHHYIVEDANFCALLRQHGYNIWVDDQLSTEIKHIGIFAVSYDTSIDGDFNNKF